MSRRGPKRCKWANPFGQGMDVNNVYGRPDNISMKRIRTAGKYSSEDYIILKEAERSVETNQNSFS